MDQQILERAKIYYYNHIGVEEYQYPFMWNQASEEYRNTFISLAKLDFEGITLNDTIY